MKLHVEILTPFGDAEFRHASAEQLSFWGGFLTEYVTAMTEDPNRSFALGDVNDSSQRFAGRFGDIDRIDLTWES